MHQRPPQPNVPRRSPGVRYTGRFWLFVILTGIGAGLGGGLLMKLLHAVQHLAFSYDSGSFVEAAAASPAWRRVAALGSAGVLAAGALWMLRQTFGGHGGHINAAIWFNAGKLPTLPTLGGAVLSIVLVGLGTSLGREGALKETGAAIGSRLAQWFRLSSAEQRLLVACGAGAGMAAAYNVPLGGALFALEVLLGSLNLAVVVPALVASWLATATAWLLLPDQPTYTVPAFELTVTQVLWALPAGPLLGLVAVLYVRLIAWADRIKPHGVFRVVAPLLVLTALGLLAIAVPDILGNGKGVAQQAFTGVLSLDLLVVLTLLKPLATASCLASGAPGGLFTPTVTCGSVLGALLGRGWECLWPGAPPGSYAVLGGGAMLAAATQGPVSAIVLTLELTRHVDALMVPLLILLAGATLVAHGLDRRSIYSARVRRGEEAANRAACQIEAAGGAAVGVVSTAAHFPEIAERVAGLAPHGGLLLVVDEHGRLVGEIGTEAVANARQIAVPLETAAAADLAQPLPTLSAALDLATMRQRLAETGRACLPLLAPDSGRLVGVFSTSQNVSA